MLLAQVLLMGAINHNFVYNFLCEGQSTSLLFFILCCIKYAAITELKLRNSV